MGGVAGHMSHLYDNPDITFEKIKEILTAASDGQLEAEEKVDGQNLFLSYSIPEGKAKGARNKGNLKAGGLDAGGLAQKFAGRGNIERTFTKGFSAFEDAVEELTPAEKNQIFGPNTNIWYNAEIMDPGSRLESGEMNPDDPGSTNVIKYDGKTLKIHDVGHFLFDPETGAKNPIPEGALEALDSVVDDMQKQLHNHDFALVRRAAINLNKLEDDEALHIAMRRINNAVNSEGLGDNNTIQDYNYVRLVNGLDGDLSRTKREELAKYLLKMPDNIGLRAIKKGLKPEDVADVSRIVDRKRMILFQAIQPIEEAIHDFTVEILRGLESRFIVDSKTEVKRLQQELGKAVKSITEKGTEDPETMALMQQHLRKIKDYSNINTPTEGVVFVYDDHIYKFTGNFAPLNQILGMFKYPRGGKSSALTHESRNILTPSAIITEEEETIKTDKAEKLVLSLPKFTPTEAWGNPNSMERQQIQRIFDTIGGGATISEKLSFLNQSIKNPSGNIRSPRRIISTLIMLESLGAVIRSFNEASAGFVFEGFLAALFRGKQIAGRSEKGNLPIQDLIAFTELKSGRSVPISLKLLNQTTSIEGSYTNLVDALDEFGEMVYIVGRKDGEKIVLEKFTFNRDNFISALAAGAKGGLVKEKNLFTLPGKTAEESITLLNSLQGDNNWPQKYQLLISSAGYDPKERARKEREAAKQEEEMVTVTDEMPDGEGVEASGTANRRDYSVQENRVLWESYILTESSQRQWEIRPPQLKAIKDSVDYEPLGTLPYSPESVVRVARMYMDKLGDNLINVFAATKELSEEITAYFTQKKRSAAISSAQQAIQSSDEIGREMTAHIEGDTTNEHFIREGQFVTSANPATGKRIALFPGKFKPPHRGHYELAKSIATRPDLNVDEVVVLISPSSKPEVNPEQSLKMWNKYLSSDGAPDNISVEIADYRSPITSVYEFVADPVKARTGDTILLLKSSKDIGDTRYNGAQSYAERNNSGVNVELIEADPIERAPGVPYHGEDAREAIAQQNRKIFDTFVPQHVDTDEVWNIFHPNAPLDSVIDEMSIGGSIEGSMGATPWGPPNTFDPYKRSTNEKPPKPKRASRKRAKRQRRR